MNSSIFLRLFHIIIVGFLFLYVGINNVSISKSYLNYLLPLGVFIIFYHLYKSYIKFVNGKSTWVNLIHILLIGPLLVYIGYYGDKTARLYFELLLMLGFAVMGYHGYYLVMDYLLD